uniref:Uncharacterized protein n=1 Tax=Panagrolaimus sp. JU765 TaxID=591449 RepID=A0AC34QCG1_9BILA
MAKFVLKLLKILHRAKKAIKPNEKDGCFSPGNPPVETNVESVTLIRHQPFSSSDCVEPIPRILVRRVPERRQSSAADLDWRLNNFGDTMNLPRIDSFMSSSMFKSDDAENENYSTILSEVSSCVSWKCSTRRLGMTTTMEFSQCSTLPMQKNLSAASSLAPERIICQLRRFDNFGVESEAESLDVPTFRNQLPFLTSC